MLYVEEHAMHWLRTYRQSQRIFTWETLKAALLEEFGSDEFEFVMNCLLRLRQTRLVAVYCRAFETSIPI